MAGKKTATNVPPANTGDQGNEGGAENAVLAALSTGMTQLLGAVQDLSTRVGSIDDATKKNAEDIKAIKTGDKDAFKRDAKTEDIERVAENRKGVDQRVTRIVDEILGTDFGVEVAPLGEDQLGYMLTIIVPDRLNDNTVEMRPVMESAGIYKKDAQGQVVMEEFRRPDRRSRKLATTDNFSAVREHCEKVRAYMHSYYAARQKPMPELKVSQ